MKKRIVVIVCLLLAASVVVSASTWIRNAWNFARIEQACVGKDAAFVCDWLERGSFKYHRYDNRIIVTHKTWSVLGLVAFVATGPNNGCGLICMPVENGVVGKPWLVE